ncbi:MAG: CHAD domain-containing protein [Marinilabiliaceae bacterium]|nr:CHAD domain-containing protein [Marinilabiliaceae bacterium]
MNVGDYFEHIFYQYKYHLAKARIKTDIQSVHDFRVAFKKIKAINSFLSVMKRDDQSLKWFETWIKRNDKIYKKGGSVRKYQLFFYYLDNLCNCRVDEFEFINEHLKEKQELFHNYILTNKVPSAKMVRIELTMFDQNETELKARFEAFYIKELRTAIDILLKPVSHEWHEARRKVKCCYLLANSNYLQDVMSNQMMIQCKKLEHDLGLWHDMLELTHLSRKHFLQKSGFDKIIAKNYCEKKIDIETDVSLLTPLL